MFVLGHNATLLRLVAFDADLDDCVVILVAREQACTFRRLAAA